MKVGDRVRLTGHPARYEWMRSLVGETGRIVKVDDLDGLDITVYAIEGLLPDGKLAWFGASYLERVEAGRRAS